MVDMACEKNKFEVLLYLGDRTPKIQKGMKLNGTVLDIGVTGACL